MACNKQRRGVGQGEEFQEDGKAILAKFHDWIEAGAGGAEG